MITRADLEGGTYLTADVWAGTTDSTVTVSIDGGEPVPGEINQPADGEGLLRGIEWSHPYALVRQLTNARMSYQSTSGDPEAQGLHLYNGQVYGPLVPRPHGRTTGPASSSPRVPGPPVCAPPPAQ
ncbi:hypothetical protein [Georgenia sp. AZ-5]|uniref:hypothetical protein n=1 Tax=Georgenia sp. AZ-5 TaxID=3367526 RepID=UPI003753FDA8